MKKNGFTLTEVVVAMAVLSIITVMCMSTIITLTDIKEKSTDKLMVINQVENFIELYDSGVGLSSYYYFDSDMMSVSEDYYFYYVIDSSVIRAYYASSDELIYELDLGRVI